MAFSLALVDFDGTLADSMPYWLRLPADTLRAAGLPQPEGFAEYIRSVPIREIARDMGGSKETSANAARGGAARIHPLGDAPRAARSGH